MRHRAPSFGREGFTLIELILFAAIFSVISAMFVGILVAVVRLQVRQGASAQVTLQSQFVLQTIQQYIEQSSNVDMPTDVATTTLKLRMPAGTDPTSIYLTGTALYLRQGTSSPAQLTSDRIQVSNLSFTKRANLRGKDAVAVTFTIGYNTPIIEQRFTQILGTTIARVSAATFDSNINASTTNMYKIGTAVGEWQSINSTIFFSGSQVGIGVVPRAALHVLGNVYVDNNPSVIILKAPDGTSCYRFGVANNGTFTTSSIACP